jgi:hypothetical protein
MVADCENATEGWSARTEMNDDAQIRDKEKLCVIGFATEGQTNYSNKLSSSIKFGYIMHYLQLAFAGTSIWERS